MQSETRYVKWVLYTSQSSHHAASSDKAVPLGSVGIVVTCDQGRERRAADEVTALIEEVCALKCCATLHLLRESDRAACNRLAARSCNAFRRINIRSANGDYKVCQGMFFGCS